jgi:hypothetical protein
VPDSSAAKEEFKASATRLHHGAEHLFGRESELARLDEAWASSVRHIVTLVAWGDVGKSSLVAHWLAHLAQDNLRGA